MSTKIYVPVKPIPIRERAALMFLEYGELDVHRGGLVLADKTGERVASAGEIA